MEDIVRNTIEWRMDNAKKLITHGICRCGTLYLGTRHKQHLRSDRHKRFVECEQSLKIIRKQLEDAGVGARPT